MSDDNLKQHNFYKQIEKKYGLFIEALRHFQPNVDLSERITKLEQKLEFLSKVHSADTEVDQWLSVGELMEYIPEKPTKATIYGWVHEKRIPYHKRTKKLLFLKSEIDEWLEKSIKQL